MILYNLENKPVTCTREQCVTLLALDWTVSKREDKPAEKKVVLKRKAVQKESK